MGAGKGENVRSWKIAADIGAKGRYFGRLSFSNFGVATKGFFLDSPGGKFW
jgi:hypothetical protein